MHTTSFHENSGEVGQAGIRYTPYPELASCNNLGLYGYIVAVLIALSESGQRHA